MSPTIFREKGYRFFFFSREERRSHVHIQSGSGEAKFWMDPTIEIAHNYGLAEHEINEVQKIIEAHKQEILNAWNTHFGS